LRRPQRLIWDHAETIATSTLAGLALPSALPPARRATGWICTRNFPGGVAEAKASPKARKFCETEQTGVALASEIIAAEFLAWSDGFLGGHGAAIMI
jgi:hypothetical protein